MTDKKKTPIKCINCNKNSGYFYEDFIHGAIDKNKCCEKCGTLVLEKPNNFPDPFLN